MADLTFDIFAKENVSAVLDKVAGKLSESEDSFGKWAIAGGAAGALIGGTLIAGISGALDMQDANAKLAAQLGATGPEAAAFGKIAGELYSNNYGDSLEGVNEAIVAVNQNIAGIGQDELPGVTAKVLNLSSAFDTDLASSTNAVAQMLKTGMAPNAQAALDIITVGMQNGSNKADDLLDTLNEYPVQFQKLGIDGQQAMGLISQGLQAGARDSDLVADSLKEFSIRAIDGSEATKGSFEALGFSANDMQDKIAAGGSSANQALADTLQRLRDMKDPSERAAIAVGLFGTQAEDMGQALYALDPTKAVAALGDVEGAADRLDQTLGSTGSANLEAFQRKMQTAFVEQIGGRALPAVTAFATAMNGNLGPAFDMVGSAVSKTVGFYERHQVVINSVGVGVGVLAGVLGAVALVQGIASGAVLTWVAGTTAASVATGAYAVVQGALNAVMSANPLAIVVLALAAVAAGVIYAYKHSETFRDVVHDAMHKGAEAVDWIKEKAVEFAAKGVEAFQKAREAIGWVREKATEVKDWVGANWPLLLGILTGPFGLAVLAITKNWDAIKEGASGLVDRVKQMPADIRTVLQGLFNPLYDNFRSVVNRIIGKWNSLSFTLGGGSFMGVDIPTFKIDTPNIPMLAVGGTAVAPGLALVGEAGPELISMPTGASVVPLPRAAEAVAATMGMDGGAGDPGAWAHYAASRAEAADLAERMAAVERLLASLPAAFAGELVSKLRQG